LYEITWEDGEVLYYNEAAYQAGRILYEKEKEEKEGLVSSGLGSGLGLGSGMGLESGLGSGLDLGLDDNALDLILEDNKDDEVIFGNVKEGLDGEEGLGVEGVKEEILEMMDVDINDGSDGDKKRAYEDFVLTNLETEDNESDSDEEEDKQEIGRKNMSS
jgi:hypothetical protein